MASRRGQVNSGRKRPDRCRTCNKPATAERTISFRGYCADCGLHAGSEAARQLHAKSGPYYDQWLKSYIEGQTRALERMTR